MGRACRVTLVVAGAMLWIVGAAGWARGSGWDRPPQAVLDVLDAPELPWARPSPDGSTLLLSTVLRYPPIADLARPVQKLAGVRIDPATNGRYASLYAVEYKLLRLADRREQTLAVPPGSRLMGFNWSADGRRFSFQNEAADGIELWVGETESGRVRRIDGLKINPVLWSEVAWMPDQRHLLVKRVPPGRGAPPVKSIVPDGPKVRESLGGAGASSTYEARDVLTSPDDEALFEYYATSQLVLVDAESGEVTTLGEPGVLAGVDPSPSGELILVNRVRKPWSYSVAYYRFPYDVEVMDPSGRVVHVAAKVPLAERVPIHGVPEGPRSHEWRPTEPATLVWSEALDGGDPGLTATHRDRMMLQRAPFTEPPRELYRAPHRLVGSWWGEKDGLLLVQEWERERRWRHLWMLNADDASASPRKLVDLSENDSYADPGWPLLHRRPDGRILLVQEGDAIFFDGSGATPEGERPFVDRLSLTTLKTERLFRSDRAGYEYFVDWLDLKAGVFLTRRESPVDPPNYFVRTLTGRRATEGSRAAPPDSIDPTAREADWTSESVAVTRFSDPAPQIRGITKRIVTYQRADGTPLSFTLYLPPGLRGGDAAADRAGCLSAGVFRSGHGGPGDRHRSDLHPHARVHVALLPAGRLRRAGRRGDAGGRRSRHRVRHLH